MRVGFADLVEAKPTDPAIERFIETCAGRLSDLLFGGADIPLVPLAGREMEAAFEWGGKGIEIVFAFAKRSGDPTVRASILAEGTRVGRVDFVLKQRRFRPDQIVAKPIYCIGYSAPEMMINDWVKALKEALARTAPKLYPHPARKNLNDYELRRWHRRLERGELPPEEIEWRSEMLVPLD